jgi:DnaJ-domain-containing protein 1
LNAGKTTGQRDNAEPPSAKPTTPSDLSEAFALFGLQTGAFFDDVSAAYKKLATQNHPDKVAHMAPEFRQLAERKMRELNAAYDQIRAFYHQR